MFILPLSLHFLAILLFQYLAVDLPVALYDLAPAELLHFFNLRCCYRAQWEIREVAWQMLKLVSEVAPNLFAPAGPNCLNGPCPEGPKCCGHQAVVKQIKSEMNK